MQNGVTTAIASKNEARGAGFVHLPEQAPWLPDFEAELFSFPHSKHDDQIDSVSQALEHSRKGISMIDYL